MLVPTNELCDQVRAVFAQLMYYCTDLVTLYALASGDAAKPGAAGMCASDDWGGGTISIEFFCFCFRMLPRMAKTVAFIIMTVALSLQSSS